MFTVSRILVPIDFSDVSRAALSAAVQLADRHNAHLYVLHVQSNLDKDLQKRLTSAPNSSVIEKGIAAGELNLMNMIEREYVNAEKNGLYLRDVPITVQISGGDVLEVVLQMVEDDRIDLIVAGTHGPRGLKGIFSATKTEKLVHRASCSVFVVKAAGYPYLRD
jgi:nucleotide-binding universal stress UspA family protein